MARFNGPMQGGLYYARRQRLARLILQNLPQWANGVVTASGHYVKNLDTAYVAISSGTTGATAPVQTHGSVSDGGVIWQRVDTLSLLAYLYQTAP